MLKGEKQTFTILKKKREVNASYIWFHAASLSEFEQERPLIERIKKEKPEYKILLTFFSFSGYETQKYYAWADIICYLPLDTNHNVVRFLNGAEPTMAFFIQPDFCFNYLDELAFRNIPVFSISSIFHRKQFLFRWYGKSYLNILRSYTYFFVQNEESHIILTEKEFNNVIVNGNTRFDRVFEIYEQKKHLPLIDEFLNKSETHKSCTLIAGNTYPKDENLILPYFDQHPEMKLIIVPHTLNKSRLRNLQYKINRPCLLYSQATKSNIGGCDCLIIDWYGLLPSIYRYGNAAYIGGGFHSCTHNILEAAACGIPVLFGPNYQRSNEACDILTAGGGMTALDAAEFSRIMDALLIYSHWQQEIGEKAGKFVAENRGATETIYSYLYQSEYIK
ncbi:MAG: 3-deoxy-D-manno-octulosonic acid transferase [Candidatus Symbiothrix sp.]|nr:3-deoxy-D-manno-octulosonic acid transferase [Candidatus Symbiothrix sp.]